MIRTSPRCIQLRSVMIFLVWSLAHGANYGQANVQKVFAPVPEPLRARLSERLKLLVEYEREQMWDKQYDLLSPTAVQGETKEAYLERRQDTRNDGGYTVLNFTPKYTGRMHEGRLEIFGCVKVCKEGKTQELNGEVAAFLEAGEWRFSQVFFDKERCSR